MPVCLQFEENWIYLFYDKDMLYNGIKPTKLIWYAGAPHMTLGLKWSLVPTMCSLVGIYLFIIVFFLSFKKLMYFILFSLIQVKYKVLAGKILSKT